MRSVTGPAVEVRRAADRFTTRLGWLESRHSFSFGRHYDPANTGHGLLVANNDDVVSPGAGFHTHPHRDMEILTWVLRGSLVHEDSTGHSGVVYPGLAQRMSAGAGILHSERNDSRRLGGHRQAEPVHFVQMWVVPDGAGRAPSYAQQEIDDDVLRAGLVVVGSGRPGKDAAIAVGNRQATLHAARLVAGQSVTLPDAPFLHLFLPVGAASLEGAGRLGAGDAVRFTATGGQRVTALEPAELLVWEMHAALAG